MAKQLIENLACIFVINQREKVCRAVKSKPAFLQELMQLRRGSLEGYACLVLPISILKRGLTKTKRGAGDRPCTKMRG